MRGESLRRIPTGQPGAGIPVYRLHYSADPTITPEKIQALRSKYTSEARYRREMEIEFEALEGTLVLPEFNRDRNLCKPFDVSDRERWTIYMALDPHPRTAHAMVWEAINKHNDRIICGEFWPEYGTPYASDGGRWRTHDYAEAIQLFESDSEYKPAPFEWARGKRLHVRRRFMDTFGKAANADEGEGEDYFDAYRRLGIELTAKAVKEGPSHATERVNLNFDSALKGHDNLAKAQDSVARLLEPTKLADGNEGPPRMRLFDNLYELIDEVENVRFPAPRKMPGDDFGLENTGGRPADERIVTFQKHVMDCVFYIETSRPRFIMPQQTPDTFKQLNPGTGY